MATGYSPDTGPVQDVVQETEGGAIQKEESVPTGADGEPVFRLYIGNLKPNTPEETLRMLFDENGILAGPILVKRSFAFVDCPDQINIDKAINCLNGTQFSGSEKMQVEPAVGRRRRTNKIQIRNFPSHIAVEEIQELVNTFGPVQKCELVGAEGLVYVTFDTADTAQQAVTRLNGIEFQGSSIKVDFANNRTRKPRLPMISQQSGGGGGGPQNANNRHVELPLRMIVGSEFVGAIIGRSGQTIHNITSQSRARVDIHRSEHSLSPETVITIKGSPESCSNACVEIMKIVQSEAQSLIKGKGPQDQLGQDRDCPLKMLCPNNLCGRIIGKNGSVIKAFMEQSGTHVVVSSANDANYFTDRIVTITGPLENCKKAEALISEKMRKCAELDQQNYQNMGMYGGGGMGPGGPMGPNYYQQNRGPYQQGPPAGPYMNRQNYQGGPPGPMYGGGPGIYGAAPPQPPQQQLEIIYLYIPETTVGAVIGSKGANIKNIMRLSGARIKILDQSNQNGGERGDREGGERRGPHRSGEELRKVILTGSPEAQWKAQFYIVEKIKTETGFPAMEDVHLRSEIMVPKAMIGRIIGKGGQHVKEMQRVSGAIVKTPDTKAFPDTEEVPVTIIGHFYASQSAQRRIRALMLQALQGPPGPDRYQGGPERPPQGRRAQNGN